MMISYELLFTLVGLALVGLWALYQWLLDIQEEVKIMIKIGNDKLFSMTEILDNLKEYLRAETVSDLKAGKCDFEISAVAGVIDEHPDFVRGYLTR